MAVGILYYIRCFDGLFVGFKARFSRKGPMLGLHLHLHLHLHVLRETQLGIIPCTPICKTTYLLTPWSRVLLEKLSVFQLVKKFPAFYGTRRFVTAFTSARHLSLSWASSIQSILSHPTSWRSILILYPIYALVSPVISFPPLSPPKPCTRLSPSPYALHAPPNSFFSIISPAKY